MTTTRKAEARMRARPVCSRQLTTNSRRSAKPLARAVFSSSYETQSPHQRASRSRDSVRACVCARTWTSSATTRQSWQLQDRARQQRPQDQSTLSQRAWRSTWRCRTPLPLIQNWSRHSLGCRCPRSTTASLRHSHLRTCSTSRATGSRAPAGCRSRAASEWAMVSE